MLNNKFTRAIFALLLAAGCCAAEATVLTSNDTAPSVPAGAWASPATTGAPEGHGLNQSSEMRALEARDAAAQQAQDDVFPVGGASKASSAHFQHLPVDVPTLPSLPPIPVSEPFSAAILASGLALMAVLKRKPRREQA